MVAELTCDLRAEPAVSVCARHGGPRGAGGGAALRPDPGGRTGRDDPGAAVRRTPTRQHDQLQSVPTIFHSSTLTLSRALCNADVFYIMREIAIITLIIW